MMTPLRNFSGVAIPLGLKNVDTDTILPAAYLKVMTRRGLGAAAFTNLRYDDAGRERRDSLFNQPRYRDAPILIAGENFGCGSSREHAAWAIADLGIKAIVAPSFGDIFSGNAFKNGILLIALPQQDVDRLLAAGLEEELAIDVEGQRLTLESGEQFAFEVDPFRKQCLVEGLDEIGLTERMEGSIAAFEARGAILTPWAADPPGKGYKA